MTAYEQWVNCLVQGQNENLFTLSALGFDLTTLRLQVQRSNHLATCHPNRVGYSKTDTTT
jgi:hypothetical protein